MIIEGKKIAQTIYAKLKKEVILLEKKPTLGAILVGDNPISLRYINQKRQKSKAVGINFELFSLDEKATEEELIELIKILNKDTNISGYIVQLPLPSNFNTLKIIESIDPEKDVDGFHPINQGKVLIGEENGFIPCTPLGIIKILETLDFDFVGSEIVILGRSNIVGKPLAALCINAGATVTICNSKTKSIAKFTKTADVVILATGQAGILSADMISKQSIVIDVGFSISNGIIVGDAQFKEINDQGNLITPVPGGVGQLTVATLLTNTLQAYKNNKI